MKLHPLLFTCVLLAACVTTPQRPSLAPLGDQGEVQLELAPLDEAARQLSLELAAIAAVRPDGTQVSLPLVSPSIGSEAGARPRLLARGRLEPGRYAGFALTFSRASLSGREGPKNLPLPPGPVRVEVAFDVRRGQATLVSAELDARESLADGVSFRPVLAGRVKPTFLVPQRLGICTNSEAHDLTVFDKRSREPSGTWPTGASPWGVAIDAAASRGYVALSGADAIQVVDLVSGTPLARIQLSLGDAPRELALTPDRRTLLSANHGSHTLSLFDPEAAFEIARLDVAEGPTSIVLDRTGTRAFVFGERNVITVVDLATRRVEGTIPTTSRPLRGQLDRSGTRLYVAQEGDPYLEVLAVPGFTSVRRVYVGLGTTFLKVDPNTDLLYVANRDEGRLAVFEPSSMLPLDSIPVAGGVGWMAISDAENALFVLVPERRKITVLELNSGLVLGEIDVGDGARVLTLAGERG